MCLCRKKQNDLVLDKIRKKEEHLNKLTGEYQKLLAYKTEKASPTQIDRPPETQEEDQNRKVNDIILPTSHIFLYSYIRFDYYVRTFCCICILFPLPSSKIETLTAREGLLQKNLTNMKFSCILTIFSITI